jgi:hypothetical protein
MKKAISSRSFQREIINFKVSSKGDNLQVSFSTFKWEAGVSFILVL